MSHSFLSRRARMTSSTALCVALCAAAQSAQAIQIFRVTNYGVDSPTCGSASAPCRSIGQAIDNAVEGDQLLVDAGRYGDLNGDGDFADPGEEHADFAAGCVVCINKGVRIFSTSTSDLTIIDAAGSTVPVSVVLISADHVTLDGFTVINGTRAGVRVRPPAANTTLTDIAALNNVSGSTVPAAQAPGFDITVSRGHLTLNRSRAQGNDIGFTAETAAFSKASIGSSQFSRNTGAGFSLGGASHTLDGSYQNRIEGVAAVGNGKGFVVGGRNHRIRDGAAIDNAGPGLDSAGAVNLSILGLRNINNGWGAP